MKYFFIAIMCLCFTQGTGYAQKPIDHYLNGIARENKKDYRGAIQEYNNVIKSSPKDTACYFARANSKLKLKDYNGAIRDYNKAISLNPNSALYYCMRATAKMHLRRNKEALVDYAAALKVEPQRDATYFDRANLRIEMKDNAGAIADLNEAIKLKPLAGYYYIRGMVRYNEGDKTGGCDDLKESSRLGFDKADGMRKQMCQ